MLQCFMHAFLARRIDRCQNASVGTWTSEAVPSGMESSLLIHPTLRITLIAATAALALSLEATKTIGMHAGSSGRGWAVGRRCRVILLDFFTHSVLVFELNLHLRTRFALLPEALAGFAEITLEQVRVALRANQIVPQALVLASETLHEALQDVTELSDLKSVGQSQCHFEKGVKGGTNALRAADGIAAVSGVAVVVLLIDTRLLVQQSRTLGRRTVFRNVCVLEGAAMVAAPLADAPLVALNERCQ